MSNKRNKRIRRQAERETIGFPYRWYVTESGYAGKPGQEYRYGVVRLHRACTRYRIKQLKREHYDSIKASQ